ncbi:hypothetical protein DYB25_008251 [Aphanomyces astaci]|uniref:Uncharacterized protein n=1 Tax=Aphanomyces astaci TaxID=112090 RepID=A0A397ALD9_APHAT|nr:hypothetical protein DYB25_008251 [Aphanomyces astaci]
MEKGHVTLTEINMVRDDLEAKECLLHALEGTCHGLSLDGSILVDGVALSEDLVRLKLRVLRVKVPLMLLQSRVESLDSGDGGGGAKSSAGCINAGVAASPIPP